MNKSPKKIMYVSYDFTIVMNAPKKVLTGRHLCRAVHQPWDEATAPTIPVPEGQCRPSGTDVTFYEAIFKS
ncbi:hypothetical protein CSA56_01930 [candidate division KSB3 bacterium]|uniref:Uncharacterized protein n=1 Tax=candidate division KSB3 bacterium TaxID=2044937 RepID=A0A2G6KKQ6_9BACT|nr:MAG: hypothetical protein CSA56_01930 [candidate division KSB3 bacterium]